MEFRGDSMAALRERQSLHGVVHGGEVSKSEDILAGGDFGSSG